MKEFFKELLNAECEVFTEIRITNNYALFGKLKGNRIISTSHVKKIRQSLKTQHIKEVPIIVVCNPTPGDGRPLFLIMDGQHRFDACMQECLPITFVVVDESLYSNEREVLNMVELLNTSSMEWDVTAFMGSKCELGDENYIRYSKVYNKFDFEHEIIFYLIRKLGMSINHEYFKKGTLIFTDEMYSKVVVVLEWLEKYLSTVEKYGKRYYLKAFLDLYFLEKINLVRLRDVVLNKKQVEGEDLLMQSGSVRQSLNHLCLDLYNNRLRKNPIGITSLDRQGNKYRLEIK
jgi:hypothetical protein